MTTTVLNISKGAAAREAAGRALREAGFGVVDVDNWEQAASVLRDGKEALVLCDRTLIESSASDRQGAPTNGLAPDVARALSHELRTPLSAMAGWLHLLESGKLDDDGVKRAITKLRNNIDDQVRTIERYLGTSRTEGADRS
jgi:signal transduction histidine kinase